MILGIVAYGVAKGVKVYDTFIQGAREGFLTVIRIMPTLIGLMVAVGILRASGFLDFLAEGIGRVTAGIGFPGELVPLSLVKMFSSSAATGLLLDLYKKFGTDSFIGLAASISMSCTETIFLHHERVFYDGKDHKDPVYTAGSPPCDYRRSGCQCGSGWKDVAGNQRYVI